MSSKSQVDAGVPGTDPRLEQLRHWLAGVFGGAEFSLVPASADASLRRYFRVEHAGRSWIAMDAPPPHESLDAYIRVAQLLAAIGVNVPRILQHDAASGFLLNSDLGARTYLRALQDGADVERLYCDALTALIRIQAGVSNPEAGLPAYTETVLRREMALFTDWFCVRHLGLELSDAEQHSLHAAIEWLAREALAQPQVFVHRDYHSRNLMLCDPQIHGPSPGILDFQDALIGPITYDLVSLLRDCYVAWPPERVYGWVERFRCELQAAGRTGAALLDIADGTRFRRWFDLMGVQRHMKAIGIFARLWLRAGRPGYLADIPRTLGYVRAVAGQYAQLQRLAELVESRILPRMDAVGHRAGGAA